jgi:hypothetical protein
MMKMCDESGPRDFIWLSILSTCVQETENGLRRSYVILHPSVAFNQHSCGWESAIEHSRSNSPDIPVFQDCTIRRRC